MTIKSKAAVKDANRILGYPFAVGEKITKAFPPAVMGKDIPLAGIFDDEPRPRYAEAGELRVSCTPTDPEIKQVIDTARGIEGLIRSTGVHAAGVILSSEPPRRHDHIHRRTRHTDGAVITEFDDPTCEDLGSLKMDFLGLRNLTSSPTRWPRSRRTRAPTSTARACRSTTSQPTSCSARGQDARASSSSTAARCGTCRG